ncbi:unnamed protein product [Vicia faba]|uniref:Uncharacterized protein n=1 Tax=Vicia faba TaxID=3906 RepID=A0AAV1BCI3_VICFA|nr:unnamed protein product [Vicia faba]
MDKNISDLKDLYSGILVESTVKERKIDKVRFMRTSLSNNERFNDEQVINKDNSVGDDRPGSFDEQNTTQKREKRKGFDEQNTTQKREKRKGLNLAAIVECMEIIYYIGFFCLFISKLALVCLFSLSTF